MPRRLGELSNLQFCFFHAWFRIRPLFLILARCANKPNVDANQGNLCLGFCNRLFLVTLCPFPCPRKWHIERTDGRGRLCDYSTSSLGQKRAKTPDRWPFGKPRVGMLQRPTPTNTRIRKSPFACHTMGVCMPYHGGSQCHKTPPCMPCTLGTCLVSDHSALSALLQTNIFGCGRSWKATTLFFMPSLALWAPRLIRHSHNCIAEL